MDDSSTSSLDQTSLFIRLEALLLLLFGEVRFFLHNERRPSVRQAYPITNLATEALSVLTLLFIRILSPTCGYSEFIILTDRESVLSSP